MTRPFVRLAIGVPGLMQFCGAVFAQECEIVQRGSILDGLTTVTVLTEESDCGDPLFAGWRCMTVRSVANNNGLQYDIELAWNRVDQSVRGTFFWLGGDGADQFLRRNNNFAPQTQDDLAGVNQIRTIESRFQNLEGYNGFPSNGTVNESAILADLIEFLAARGVIRGVVGHVGSSGGSQLAADALAYHEARLLYDGVVLTGGPMFVNLEPTCTDPASPLYGSDTQRGRVDSIIYQDTGTTPCRANNPDPDPPYECRSTFGPTALTNLENVRINVITGTTEDPWVVATADYYYNNIIAASKTQEHPDAPHVVFSTQVGADAVYNRAAEIVDQYEPCSTDLNADGQVDLEDLAAILAIYGQSAWPVLGDFDASGSVDLNDLALMLAQYGNDCR